MQQRHALATVRQQILKGRGVKGLTKYIDLTQGACTLRTWPLMGNMEVSPNSCAAPRPVQFTTRSYSASSCKRQSRIKGVLGPDILHGGPPLLSS